MLPGKKTVLLRVCRSTNAQLVNADRRFLVCQRSEIVECGARIICEFESLVGYIEK